MRKSLIFRRKLYQETEVEPSGTGISVERPEPLAQDPTCTVA